MNKLQKNDFSIELKDKFLKANLALFADYKGLTATQADQLRKILRVQKAEVKVIKNNVARKALALAAMGPDADNVAESTVGPTLVAFGYGDLAATAKAIYDFSKDNQALKIKDSLMGKVKISALEVEQLANLPSREVLLSMLLRTLNGPVSGFVGVLAAVPRSFVSVLAQIEKKKGSN